MVSSFAAGLDLCVMNCMQIFKNYRLHLLLLYLISSTVRTYCMYLSTGAIALPNARFAEGQKPTSINVLNCYGNESRLLECGFVGPAASQSCGRREDAGVVCQGELQI